MSKLYCGKCRKMSPYHEEGNLVICEICGAKNVTEMVDDMELTFLSTYKDYTFDKREAKKDYTIEAWIGYNYQLHKLFIDKFIDGYDFKDLQSQKYKINRLDEAQIKRLKIVLKEGFKKEQNIKMIAQEIRNFVKPGPIYRPIGKEESYNIKEATRVVDKVVYAAVLGEEYRALMIARTEIVRSAAEGVLNFYSSNNIKMYRWIASYGERTCPECGDLNNQLFKIGNGPVPPAHAMCRCTTVAE